MNKIAVCKVDHDSMNEVVVEPFLVVPGVPEGVARRLRTPARPRGLVLPGHVLPRPRRARLALRRRRGRRGRRPRLRPQGGGAAAVRRVRLQGRELRQGGEVLRRLRATVPVHGVSNGLMGR